MIYERMGNAQGQNGLTRIAPIDANSGLDEQNEQDDKRLPAVHYQVIVVSVFKRAGHSGS